MPGAAVADVTHLLAELIENATLYSPPNTRVRVSAGRVANGHVVEIEDRGLGIPAETLAVLNERLVQPPEFDLADSDQLGLFVVSRLAARHGIKVSLRGSAYGGTAAIVLLPHHLVVAEEDAAGPDGQTAAPAAIAGLGRAADTPASKRWPLLELNAGAAFAEPGNVQTQLPVWPERPDETTVPAQETPSPDDQLPASADSHLGLPRRLRQASLAPQLRDSPPASSSGGQHEARSAEQVRALISSIQQGWRSGRAAADRADGDIPGADPGSGHGEAGR